MESNQHSRLEQTFFSHMFLRKDMFPHSDTHIKVHFFDGELVWLILSTKMKGHSLKNISGLRWDFCGGRAEAVFS